MYVDGVPNGPEAPPETTEKTQFCLYDVLQFLARLSCTGRCRFYHQPFEKEHGVVQRPELDVHPEHRIHPLWASRASSSGDQTNEAIGAPNRSVNVDATWAETLASGRAAEVTPLSADVRNLFHALAFRFGRTLRELETVERPRWEPYLRHRGDGRSVNNAMQASIRMWHATYQALVNQGGARHEARLNWIPTSFAKVIQYADLIKFSELQAAHGGSGGSPRRLSEAEARAIVQQHNRSDSVWDWAHPSIVGEAPQFFHMQRGHWTCKHQRRPLKMEEVKKMSI
ncbi:hypothetical protein Sste5346_002454 [Sporothrix stenoceras]|uniref:C3H1-type domain-containing protein n=1 Tax=Sporothrix stenoceras TaxID=5173 RepID=A0ABR3ZIB8_9PEZI